MQCYITITSKDGSSTLFSALTSDAQKCDKWERNVSVNSIEINKELYTPNSVQVQLQIATIAGSMQALSMNTIKDDLLEAQLSVWSVPGTDTSESQRTYLVQKYQIHKVQPVMGKEVCINFTAYSPDVQLTYDKHCATWVGKRLAREIVPSALNGTYKDASLYACLNALNIHHLRYNENKELIQPYLVQYNESFYDFLRRVAYRCGEYLYWENNQLYLGLDTLSVVRKDILYTQCVADYAFQSTTDITAVHRNVFDDTIYNDKDGANMFQGGLSYFEANSGQDYFDKVKEYSKTMSDIWKPKQQVVRYLSSTLKKGNLADMVLNITTSITSDMTKAAIKNDKAKDKFNAKWAFDSDGAQKRIDQADQFISEDGKQAYTLFSSTGLGSTSNLDAAFYKKMQKGSLLITDTRMTVTLNTSEYQHVGLGDIIQLKGNQTDKFIVTRVYRKELINDITYTVDVITYDENNLYPPVPRQEVSFPLIREAAAQTAYVNKNGDPLGMGRVRIKYPWQGVKEDASPWVRMSAQMASKDSGFYFDPQVNDEVLINFVGGNVEQPYVAGCLYNGAHKAAGSSAITSVNGHSISFSDPQTGSGFMFVNEFLPLWGFITTKEDEKADDDLKKAQKEVDDAFSAVKPSSVVSDGASVDTSTSDGIANAVYLKKKLDFLRNFYMAANSKPNDFKSVMPYNKVIQFERQCEAELERVPESVYNPVPDSIYSPIPEKVTSPIPVEVYTPVPDEVKKVPADFYEPIPRGVDKLQYIAEKQKEWDKLNKAEEWQNQQKEEWKNQQIAAWKQTKAEEWQEKQKKDYVKKKFETDLAYLEKNTALDNVYQYIYDENSEINKKKALLPGKTGDDLKKLQDEIDEMTAKLKPYQDFYNDAVNIKVTWDDVAAKYQVTINENDFTKNALFYMHKAEIMDRLTKYNSNNQSWQQVVDADWTQLKDEDWRNTDKVKIGTSPTYNNMNFKKWGGYNELWQEMIKDATSEQDSASDERWFLPMVSSYSGSNMLDKLADKIAYLDNKLRDVKLPDKADGCKNDQYKEYLNKKAALKTAKERESNSKWKGDECRGGGITMTDTLGLYKIAMDAGKRNISISSPLGDVKIDAFSGISIEAPTGDVSIKGKNITLEAGNNIKIISGKNKFDKATKALTKFAKGLVDTAISVGETALTEGTGWSGKIVDLKTLRLVYECIITPVEGTLQIHSGNNLILESNDAKAHLPLADINSKSNRNEVAKGRLKSLNAAVDMVTNQEKYITSIIAPLKDATDSFVKLLNRNAYTSSVVDPTTGVTTTTTQTLSKRYYGKANADEVIAMFFSQITDGEVLIKNEAYKVEDFTFSAGYNPTKRDLAHVKLISEEAESMRKVIKGYIDSVNNFKDTLEDNFKTIGADDLAEKVAALYPLKQATTNVIIRLDGHTLLPNSTISGLWDADKKFTNYSSDASRNKARREALIAIASKLTDGGYSGEWYKASFEGLWKDINTWFGKDIKPVAQYVNATDSSDTFAVAKGKINDTTSSLDWSNYIDNFVEPDLGTAVTMIKDALSKLVGDLTGLDKLGKDATAIIDDAQGISAQRTGKFLISTKGDTTVEVGENGTISEVPTGSASLKSLKKKLQKGW